VISFLSSANYFKFANLDESPTPFFSRRIGLDNSGQPVDIRLGAKLGGRIEPWTFGLMHVETGASETLEQKHLSVARVTRQFDESTLGVIGTLGDPRGSGNAHLFGADYNYMNSDALPDKRLGAHVWAMQTRSDAAGGTASALGGSLSFPNEPWSGYVALENIDSRFDPALGFLSRSGIRNYYSELFYRFRPNSNWLRSVELGKDIAFTTRTDNRFDSYQIYLPSLFLETSSGSKVFAALELNRERIDESFEPANGVNVPPGNYVFQRPFIKIETPPSHPLSVVFRYLGGRYYDGSLETLRTELAWKPSPHWQAVIRYEFGALRMPTGQADIHLTSLRLSWLHSTSFSINNTLQYDNEARSAGFNSRLRWTLFGDNDFFIVFQRGYVEEDQLDSLEHSHKVRRYSQALTAKVEWRVAL
jgi:hypothetical protein